MHQSARSDAIIYDVISTVSTALNPQFKIFRSIKNSKSSNQLKIQNLSHWDIYIWIKYLDFDSGTTYYVLQNKIIWINSVVIQFNTFSKLGSHISASFLSYERKNAIKKHSWRWNRMIRFLFLRVKRDLIKLLLLQTTLLNKRRSVVTANLHTFKLFKISEAFKSKYITCPLCTAHEH